MGSMRTLGCPIYLTIVVYQLLIQGMDERFSQMMDFNLHQFDIMMQQMHEQSHTGRSQVRQSWLSEASSAPRTSNMFQAKVEREEYETEVKLQNDLENQMSFSSLKNRTKLSTPPIFNGTYSEEYNILNWIIAVELYLLQCEISTRAYSSFAYPQTRFEIRRNSLRRF